MIKSPRSTANVTRAATTTRGLHADNDAEMQDVRRVTRTGQRPDELVGPVDHLPEEDDQPNAELMAITISPVLRPVMANFSPPDAKTSSQRSGAIPCRVRLCRQHTKQRHPVVNRIPPADYPCAHG